MTAENLTAVLAERVMGWTVTPDRFLKANRGWMPRWRFRPVEKLSDALRLLEKLTPEEYSLHSGDNGSFHVWVRIRGVVGEAQDASKPRAVAHAVARALGIEVDR